jgi:hypothetical protein
MSALWFHSNPNREARMEVDNGYDRKRQYGGNLYAVRQQVLAWSCSRLIKGEINL